MSRSKCDRETATHAEPDDADPTGAVWLCRDPRTGCFDLIEQAPLPGHHLAEDRNKAADLPAPVEEVRGHREVTGTREPICLAPGVFAQTAGIVDHHDAGPRPGALRPCHVGWHYAMRSGDGGVGHQDFTGKCPAHDLNPGTGAGSWVTGRRPGRVARSGTRGAARAREGRRRTSSRDDPCEPGTR